VGRNSDEKMIAGKKQCKVIETLKKLKVASATQIAEILGEEKKIVQGRIQTLKRKGVIEGVGKVKKTLTTEFTYKLANEKKKADPEKFNGYMSVLEIKKFQQSVKGTPWAQLAVLV
jgi:predicted ArsR family transcriptional regulator